MLNQLIATADRYINYQMAVVGSLLLGGLVFMINYSHGYTGALTAALKQACYTFFFAGFITQNNERMSNRGNSRTIAFSKAVTSSSILAIGCTLMLHELKGTPEPFFSTIPTIVMAPPGFAFLAWREQKKSNHWSN